MAGEGRRWEGGERLTAPKRLDNTGQKDQCWGDCTHWEC